MTVPVMIAVDDSDHSRRVIEYTKKNLNADSVRVHVTVVAKDLPAELLSSSPRGMNPQELEEAMSSQAAEIAESVAEDLREHGFDVEVETPVGHPGEEICELARELGVSQIIMGKRGRSEVRELFLGSTSQYVLHHADCAVTILPEVGEAA